MKHNAKGLKRIACVLCGLVVMLVMNMAGITAVTAQAAGSGIYIATATPHYRHPQTGVIEDSGGDGSAVLGQSMTDSATYKKALVEVDASGNTFVTVRLQLMDNIQNPQFQVDGSPVTATLMQEDYSENTADYRMKVNSENSVIRCNMYVIAMGRSVIFYITVSGLQPGSDDFITSITADTPAAPADNGEAAQGSSIQSGNGDSGIGQADSSENGEATTVETENITVTETTTAETETTTVTETTTAETESTTAASTTTTSSTDASKSSDSAGLEEFDAYGKQVNKKTKDKTSKKTNPAPFIIMGIVVVAAAGCGIWFYLKKKK